MRSGVCFDDSPTDYSRCTTDVLDIADRMCSGRQSCLIEIPNEEMEQAMRCPGVKGYFSASYSCVSGMSHLFFSAIVATVTYR
jgi:hypothetical protein